MAKLAAMLRLDREMIMIPESSFAVPVLMCPGLRWAEHFIRKDGLEMLNFYVFKIII